MFKRLIIRIRVWQFMRNHKRTVRLMQERIRLGEWFYRDVKFISEVTKASVETISTVALHLAKRNKLEKAKLKRKRRHNMGRKE